MYMDFEKYYDSLDEISKPDEVKQSEILCCKIINNSAVNDVGGGITEEAGFETGFNPDNGIVVGYDLEGGSITDTVGILTTIDLTGYIGMTSIEICMTDVILTGPTGWDLYEAITEGCITIENQLGDINYDGQINVLDIVQIVNLILEQ